MSVSFDIKVKTCQTDSASLTIPTLFLVSPDRCNIKRYKHGILYLYCMLEQYSLIIFRPCVLDPIFVSIAQEMNAKYLQTFYRVNKA